MNYRNSINTAMNAINKFEPSEQIGNILEDFSEERERAYRDKYDGSIEGRLNDMRDRYERRGSGTGDSFVVQQTFVLRMNICGKNRQLLVAAKRYKQA